MRRSSLRCGWLLLTMCFSVGAQEDSLERDYSGELGRISAVEAGEALGTFEVLAGFRMKLVAAEPLVRDPVAMAFDEYGRLFVVEMRGYSEEREKNIGAVRLLTDVDGDGVFDESSVYVDGLAWPTAVACFDGGIFVGVPPDILYCKDTDGDGLADVERRVFSGFHHTNVQGLLNSFNWGLDNRIHGATSSSGADVTRMADGAVGPPLSLRGRDFAFDPKTLGFDSQTPAIEAESGGGQHGLSFDAWGRKYVSHNSDHIQLMVYEDRYTARNPYYAARSPRESIAADGPAADVFRISPVEPWRIVRTRLRVQGLVPGPIEGGGTAAGYFTSATGVTIYKGDAWPAEYRGNAFIGDVGSNLIHRKTIEANGVSLIARRADEGTEFVRSTDIWFRPVQFANAPDGTLYVADMYREVIEHPDSLPPIIKQHLDLTSGNDRGRIYRIVPEGYEQRPTPKLGEMSTVELVGLLAHENGWHRETAQRLLYERQDLSAVEHLEELLRISDSPLGQLHALYTLDGLDVLRAEHLVSFFAHEEPRLREHALILSEQFVSAEANVERIVEMTLDPDARVRYQAAFALGGLRPEVKAWPLADVIRRDGNNSWFEVAIMTSLPGVESDVFVALVSDADYRARDGSGRMLELIARQVGAAGTAEGAGRALAAIATLPASDAALGERTVKALLEGTRIAVRGGDVREAIAASESAQRHLAQMVSDAREALSGRSNERVRVEAARALALAEYDEALRMLTPLLTGQEPSAVQSAAVEVLSTFDGAEVGETLLRAWPKLGPRAREVVIEALLSRSERVSALLDAVAAGEFLAANLDSTRVHQLMSHPEARLRDRAKELLQAGPRADLEALSARVLGLEGDRARGKAVYEANCAQCHRAEGLGHAVGPDFATLSNAGREKILSNILEPNREINPQYTYYLVETRDGETHTGIIASETATSVTLMRGNALTTTVLRANIESIESTALSLMPEEWEKSLSEQDLADIAAFITGLSEEE